MLDKLIQEIGPYYYFYFIFCSVGVFFISLFLIPKIRSVALRLNLKDTPDDRSSHTIPVPTFGGVAFYVSYILVM